MLLLAASAEAESEHPLAAAIVSYAAGALGFSSEQPEQNRLSGAANGKASGAAAAVDGGKGGLNVSIAAASWGSGHAGLVMCVAFLL